MDTTPLFDSDEDVRHQTDSVSDMTLASGSLVCNANKKETEPVLNEFSNDDSSQLRSTHHEENNPIPSLVTSDQQNNHGCYNPSIMMMFLLGACGAAVMIIPSLIPCDAESLTTVRRYYDTVYIVSTSCLVLLTCICGFCLVMKKRWISKGDVMTIGNRCILGPPGISRFDSHPFPYEIIVFGIGCFILRSIQMLDTVYELTAVSDFFDYVSYSDLHLVGGIVFLTATVIHIGFLVKFKYTLFKSCAFFHVLIASWIGGSLPVWFFVALIPIYEVNSESCYNSTPTFVNNTQEKYVFDTMINFLNPFEVEFVAITIGIFLNLWNRFDNKTQESEPSNNKYSIIQSEDETPESEQCKNRGHKLKYMTLKTFLFLIPFIMSISFVVAFLIEYYYSNNHNIFLWTGIRILFHFPLFLFFIPVIKAMRKTNLRLKLSSFTCSEIVLLVAHTVNYVYAFFRFFSALSLLISPNSTNMSTLEIVSIMIYSTILMAENWCQTYYILAMICLQRYGRKMNDYDKFGLYYNTAFQLAEWGILALTHEWALDSFKDMFPALSCFLGNHAIRVAILLVLPMMEFYRFHAAVVCFQIARCNRKSLENSKTHSGHTRILHGFE